jgi:PAS domain S-box-containing protein
MSTPSDATRDEAELRRLAELRLAANAKRSRLRQRREDPRVEPERILHELHVHQVELEMQNAELLATRDRLEQMVEKCTDLYYFDPVGYLSLDPRGRILEANLTGALWFGVARGRLVQRVMGTMVALESQPVLQAWLDDVFTVPGDHTCQIQVLRPSGAPSLWLSLRASEDNCSDDRHRWCRVAASDITARRTLEERMQRNGELLGALVEQVPMGMYLVDARMVLQQANPGARLIFSGVEPLIGRPLEEILHVVWKNRVVEEIMGRFRETLTTGRTYHSAAFTERRRDLGIRESYEWQIQRVTLSSGETGVVCFFSDITERKHSEVIRRR